MARAQGLIPYLELKEQGEQSAWWPVPFTLLVRHVCMEMSVKLFFLLLVQLLKL